MLGKIKAGGHDAGDDGGFTVQHDGMTDQLRVGSEHTPPQTVAEHDFVRPVGSEITSLKLTPEGGPSGGDGEEVLGNVSRRDLFGEAALADAGDVLEERPVCKHVLERLRALAQV